jgi:hypothetical protein
MRKLRKEEAHGLYGCMASCVCQTLFTSIGVQRAMDNASMSKMMQMMKQIGLIKLIKRCR